MAETLKQPDKMIQLIDMNQSAIDHLRTGMTGIETVVMVTETEAPDQLLVKEVDGVGL